jgi:hypothetical protein
MHIVTMMIVRIFIFYIVLYSLYDYYFHMSIFMSEYNLITYSLFIETAWEVRLGPRMLGLERNRYHRLDGTCYHCFFRSIRAPETHDLLWIQKGQKEKRTLPTLINMMMTDPDLEV